MKLKKLIINTLVITSVTLCTLSVQAAELPWGNSTYAHYSNQEPLRELLTSLATSQKTPVVVSKKVDLVVSIYFKTNQTKKIFEDLVKTYNLSWFYDGDTLYIYTKEEVQTGSVALKYISPEMFTRSLKRLGILDDHFYWVASNVDKMIYFKGPERFVSSVLDMSKVLDKEKVKREIEKGSIYKWVDQKGVTNFGSELPKALDKSRTSEKIESLGYEIVK